MPPLINLLRQQKTVGLLLLLTIALAYLFIRGPWRAAHQTVDLPTFYGAAKAWVIGDDPYDHTTIKRLYDDAGGDGQFVARCVNPPSFMPVTAPLGVVPYQPAKFAMIGINLITLGLAIWIIGQAAGLFTTSARALLFCAAACALAPIHTTIAQGQHGIMVVAILALAMRAERSGKDSHIGLYLALAAALKPQMVVLFGFYYLAQRRWVVVLSGALGTAALLAIGIGRMELVGIDWLNGIRTNLEAFTAAPAVSYIDMSGAANYHVIGDDRFIMLDIATLGHAFTHHEAAIKLLRLTVGAAIILAALRLNRRKATTATQRLLVYAMLSVGCLAASYNRFYAATVLVLVIAAGMRLILVERQRIGWLMIALCAPFVVPGSAILLTLQGGALADSRLPDHPIWRHLLLPHQVYLILALLVTICVAMRQLNRQAHVRTEQAGGIKT